MNESGSRSGASGMNPPQTKVAEAPLRRILGPVSILCVGVGGAIGSGIFAAPGEAARLVHSPWLILLAWLLAGLITFLQSLVTAELATRFPRAGGEYQYLKSAYGEFAAFFFGWSFTVFIVGGGAGTIAAAFGRFAADFLGTKGRAAESALGCSAIIAVTLVNCMGLRTGAATQNVLTILKTLSLVAIGAGAMILSGRVTPVRPAAPEPADAAGASPEAFLLVLMTVYWSYTGATDPAKLAEETRDVRRSLPLALLASAGVLTGVYCFYNYALFCGAAPADMAGHASAPTLVFERAGAALAGRLTLLVGCLVFLGSISSVFLANIRVTYALARDGLAFRWLAAMSSDQAPIGSLVVGGAIACAFVIQREFGQILRIYFLASTVLFGLSYLSLIVFRRRERRPAAAGCEAAAGESAADVYRAAAGEWIAALLVLFELAIAAGIVRADFQQGSRDSLWTMVLLAALGTLYFVWKKPASGSRSATRS